MHFQVWAPNEINHKVENTMSFHWALTQCVYCRIVILTDTIAYPFSKSIWYLLHIGPFLGLWCSYYWTYIRLYCFVLLNTTRNKMEACKNKLYSISFLDFSLLHLWFFFCSTCFGPMKCFLGMLLSLQSRLVITRFEKGSRTFIQRECSLTLWYAFYRLNKNFFESNDDVFYRFVQIDSW
jgi:hypothetical protein